MNFDFIKKAVSSNSGVSSKRICGGIGWLCCMIGLLWCTFSGNEAPKIYDISIVISSSLLGLDTVTNIWKKDAGGNSYNLNIGTSNPEDKDKDDKPKLADAKHDHDDHSDYGAPTPQQTPKVPESQDDLPLGAK